MVRIVTGMLVALGAAGLLYGQDGEKKPAPKGDGFKEPAKEGGVKEGGEKGPGPRLLVSEVDTDGDGWITAAEMKMALSKMGGGGQKDGGKKPGGVKDGEGKKPEGLKDGDFKKPEGFKGDVPKKVAPKEGEKEGGDKKSEK